MAGGLVASAAVCKVVEDVGRGGRHHLFIHISLDMEKRV